MKKLEKLKKVEIKKNEMSKIKGGTSCTEWYETCRAEMEQETDGKGGKPIGEPVLTQM